MKWIACFALMLLVVTTTFSQDRDDDIKSLLALTGSGKLAVQMMDQIILQMGKLFPQVPEKVWEEFRSRASVNDFVAIAVPIYRKHYSQEEIQQLLAFYRTPLGQKVIAETPAILQESMAAGREWGESIAQDWIQSLKGMGYEPKHKDGT